MNAAQWIKIPLLLDLSEMQLLVEHLVSYCTHPNSTVDCCNATREAFMIFRIGCLVEEGSGNVSHEEFLSDYDKYLALLKADQPIVPFGRVWTRDIGAVKRQVITGGREIIRPIQPLIQLQPYHFQFDPETRMCHPMIYGTKSIPWGIQFSYPHLFENPQTHEIMTVDARFPNTALFHSLRQFVREYTVPTPWVSRGHLIHLPIRLGKRCFTWINEHPRLVHNKIKIRGAYDSF